MGQKDYKPKIGGGARWRRLEPPKANTK